jgi:hypothetical protein
MSQRNESWTESERDGVSKWLIHRAALHAPESLSLRLEEEWLADLECRSTALSETGPGVGLLLGDRGDRYRVLLDSSSSRYSSRNSEGISRAC